MQVPKVIDVKNTMEGACVNGLMRGWDRRARQFVEEIRRVILRGRFFNDATLNPKTIFLSLLRG